MRRKSSKIISFLLLALLFAAGVFGGGKSVKAGVNSTWTNLGDTTNPCYEITGVTTPITVDGVQNAGAIHFGTGTYGSVSIDSTQAACVLGTPDSSGNYQIRGWAYDDNVGPISFACDSSGSGDARTPKCGTDAGGATINYGTYMSGPSAMPGTIHGFAWGDGTGWISFDAANPGNTLPIKVNYDVSTDTLDAICLGKVYDSSLTSGCNYFAGLDLTTNPGPNLAWSDNIGWINFTGVTFPWPTYPTGLQPVFRVTRISDTANPPTSLYLDSPLAKSAMPYADGADGYKVSVMFLQSGVALPASELAKYTVTSNFNWSNTVTKDQTKNGTTYDAVSGLAADLSSIGAYDPANGYSFNVTSVAPTENGNQYMDGTEVANNQSFVVPSNNSVTGNDLKLNNFQLSVKDNLGKCVIGNGAGCTQMPLVSNLYFDFKPTAEVSKLNLDEGGGVVKNYLEGTVNTTYNLNVASTCEAADCGGATVAFNYGNTSSYKTKTSADPVVLSIDGSDVKTSVDLLDSNNGIWGGTLAPSITDLLGSKTWTFEPVLYDPQSKTGSNDTVVKDPYIYSVVTLGNGAKYYSAKLPRVDNGTLINPVLTIKGNVYSTGIFNAQSTDAKMVKSLGDVSTNILRDQIAKNVATITAGVKNVTNGSITGSNGNWIVSGGKSLLVDRTTQQPKVYYFACDKSNPKVDINPNGASYGFDRTIITVGCNVHIKSNILADKNMSPKPKLGLIVLKDLVKGIGGNVYIDPSVTDIQANIFADGSVFSDGGSGYNNDDSPQWSSERARRDVLVNQLYIEGSVASLNTIGGATKSPPIAGDGTQLCDSEGSYSETGCPTSGDGGRQEARNFDLNFLRYYGMGCPVSGSTDLQQVSSGDTCPNGAPKQPIGQGKSSSLLQVVAPGNTDAVYIKFDPPSATLPGFTSQGQGLNLQQRIQ